MSKEAVSKETMCKQITFEALSEDNIEYVRSIQRDDISEAFVDPSDAIMKLTD